VKALIKMWMGILALLGCSVAATNAESCSPVAALEKSCTIKANARELLFVGYAVDGDETAVDEIWVRMKNETTRYADLLEDGCGDKSESVVKVSFQEVPSSSSPSSGEIAWQGELKKNVKHHREFQIKNLNPCQKYRVKVSVDSTDLDLFEVGPFYSEEQSFAYLENSEDNKEFQTKNQEAAEEVKISSDDTSATLKITPSNFCARSIGISLKPEGTADTCEAKTLTVHNEAAANPSKEGATQGNEVTFENLQPCTKYKVMLDVFLNKREATTIASDFHFQPSATFHTLPSNNDLKKEEFVQYDAATSNFSWDFTKFFEQACAGSLEFTAVQMIRDGETENYEALEGSSDVVKDCAHEAQLVVLFKEAGKETSVVALSQTIPRNSTALAEKLFVDENDVLQIIRDPCLSSPSIKLVPNDKKPTPKTIPFEKAINMSEVAWEGCFDYSVKVTRSPGFTYWPKLLHPGWKNLLADWILEVDDVDHKSITFKPLEKACEVENIKLEVDCDGRVHANEKFESNQWAEALLVEHVMSGAEYECRARLVDTKGGEEVTGPWTKGTRVNTTKEVEEEKRGQMLTASGNTGEEDTTEEKMDGETKAQEGAAGVVPTVIGIGCIVVIVALAVVIVWRGMAGKKVEPNPLLQDLDENLSEVLVSSEEEVKTVEQREPGSGSDPIKDVSDPIKDQHGSIVGALELNAPHVDAREA